MTDIDYKKIKDDIDSIISNTGLLVANIKIDELNTLNKKIKTITSILNGLSLIAQKCRQKDKDLDMQTLMMAMLMNKKLEGNMKEAGGNLWDKMDIIKALMNIGKETKEEIKKEE